MAGAFDINSVGPEDIKSWPKMAFQLLKRSWWVWLLIMTLNVLMSFTFLSWPGGSISGKIFSMVYEAVVPVFMFELAMVIAMKSDLQFSWKGVWHQLRVNYSSPNIYKVHGVWIIWCCLIWNLLFFGYSSDIEQFSPFYANGDWFHMITMALEHSSKHMLGVLLLCALTPAGAAFHYLRVICQQDHTTAVAIGTKIIRNIVLKNFKALFMMPLLMLITGAILGDLGAGVILLPFMITWRYVAAREIMFGGGNKAVEKKTATYGFALPQGAGA